MLIKEKTVEFSTENLLKGLHLSTQDARPHHTLILPFFRTHFQHICFGSVPSPHCFKKSLHNVVVEIGTATQAAAHQDQGAAQEKQTNQDVNQSGGPEGKQVKGLVAVGAHICCVFGVVGLINRVDPYIT